MGTKVQLKTYSRSYYSIADLKDDPSNRGWPVYYGDKMFDNRPYYDGCWPRSLSSEYVGMEKDLVKQTILEHEAIFRNQVYELHRLYKIQKDMMDEIRRKEHDKQRLSEASLLSEHAHEEISNCSNPIMIQRKMFDLQLPADEYIEIDEEHGVPEKDDISLSLLGNGNIVNKLCDLNEPAEDDEIGNGIENHQEEIKLPICNETPLRSSDVTGFVKLKIDLNSCAGEETCEEDEVKQAAGTLVLISSVEDDSMLHWFVDLVLSPEPSNTEMDFFESMTLKLEESAIDEFIKPREMEETAKGRGLLSSRARGGRHKRDFQRDILPGLASLSRHEVSEDLQRFGGLSRRNGLRKRCGKGIQAALLEAGFDVGSLAGWGRTTRRPRRPRCHPSKTLPVRST